MALCVTGPWTLWGIELLLSTVNGVAVPEQEEWYPVADKLWKKCWEPLPTISEMGWQEFKPV